MIEYNYCPKCGGRLDKASKLPHCPSCDITYYRNAKPCSSVLIIQDGKVLLGKRRNEPYIGRPHITSQVKA